MIDPFRPFAGAEPHLIHPGLSYAVWFTQPLGVVTRMLKPAIVNQELADFITGPLHEAVRSLARPDEKTFAVHDWSAATRYDTGARLYLTEWILSHRSEFVATVVIGPKENAILRMGLQVAQAILGMTGCALELSNSPGHALKRHRLALHTGEVPAVPGTLLGTDPAAAAG